MSPQTAHKVAEGDAPKGDVLGVARIAGIQAAKRTAEQIELERLRRKTERLEAELVRTRLALEITGKAHALLELISESAASETKLTK